TCAIPFPIAPAPSTPIVLIVSMVISPPMIPEVNSTTVVSCSEGKTQRDGASAESDVTTRASQALHESIAPPAPRHLREQKLHSAALERPAEKLAGRDRQSDSWEPALPARQRARD